VSDSVLLCSAALTVRTWNDHEEFRDENLFIVK